MAFIEGGGEDKHIINDLMILSTSHKNFFISFYQNHWTKRQW